MPVDEAVDQSQEDALIKQYGGTVQGGAPASAAAQPMAQPSEDDIINRYGGKVGPTIEPSGANPVGEARDPGAEQFLEQAKGIPLYQTAPGAPKGELPPPVDAGRYSGDLALGRQVQSAYYGNLAAPDRLAANVAGLLDTAATKISGLTGLDKGGLFKHIEDWLREQQKYREEQAAEYAGGREDLPSKAVRSVAGGLMSLPITAGAAGAIGSGIGAMTGLGTLGSSIAGMAGLGALETGNQGPGNAAKGALEGGLTGAFLHLMGPYGRMIRIPAVAGVELAKNLAQGVDPETAFTNALNMGFMSGLGGPGTKSVLPESLPPGLRVESKLNPTQQAAVDYLRDQGVPLTAGQQTGNRYLTAVEATTAHTPLGSQKAREFHAGTESALRDLAGELAGQAHGEPVSPYEAGTIVGDTLTHSIGELAGQANQAYEKAWEHAGDPAYTKKVQIKTATEPVLDAAGEPTGKTKKVPVYGDVNMPVDVRWMKAIARDQIPKYEYLPAADRAQSAAYSILKGVLKGNDHISAQQAEEALKGLKAEVGYGTDPNMRNAAQGTAAQMVPRLQKAIDAAVGETGQDAVIGLQEGRKLHAQKMDFADVQKKLRQEPVQAFGQLTQGRDSGVNYLKEVAQRAPDSLPVLGRAYLDTLFEKAMKEGGWMRTDGVFKAWDNLGDQTKALLFPKEGQVRALDRFFLAQKITAERINTSGTALVKEAQDAGTNLLKWLKGKYAGDILFSPRGIKFLTGIAQNPPRSSAEVTALQKQAEAAFGAAKGPEKPPEETPPVGGPPAGGGTPPPAAPGGGHRGAGKARAKK